MGILGATMNKYDEELGKAKRDAWASCYAANAAAATAATYANAAAYYAAAHSAYYAASNEKEELNYQINKVLELL